MIDMEQFKDLWVQTARERIQELSDLLLKLEKSPDELELVNELMRTGHSLKGESAAMGYEQIATLAHVIEDLFTGIGNSDIKFNPDIMDHLLAAIDYISLAVDAIEANKPEPNSAEIVNNIKAVTGLKTEGFGKTDKSKSVVNSDGTSAEKKEEPVKADQKVEKTENAPIVDEKPVANQSSAGSQISSIEVAKPANKQISTVTLKIEKLDQLLSVNEELVLLKMKLKNNDVVENNADLKAEIHRLDRLVTDMQFYLMQTRLFPISMALQTIPRLVRDTARKVDKEVRLEIEGDDTTVDRTIIDHLSEAYVHMVRNSIDHGLESTENRKKVGKPVEGVVKIKSYTKENKFYSEVSDDGGGIEWDKLVKKAVEKGLYTKEETDRWTDKDKEKLLYTDGVSASDAVSDVSGRGVGLGAVEQAIRKLGGSISVITELGKGTTFTLRMPMTLAIMQALLVKVDHHTYAMPSHEIVRSIQVPVDQIKSSGNLPVIVVDKTYVPLVRLSDKFGTKATEDNSGKTHQTVVLIKQNEDVMGCLVDKIVAEEEILVKPLGPMLKHSQYFSGITILADGSAAPIINFEGLKWKQLHS